MCRKERIIYCCTYVIIFLKVNISTINGQFNIYMYIFKLTFTVYEITIYQIYTFTGIFFRNSKNYLLEIRARVKLHFFLLFTTHQIYYSLLCKKIGYAYKVYIMAECTIIKETVNI